MYPKGDYRANGKWLSIFLNLDGTDIIKADEKIYVRALVKVIDPRGSNHFTKTSMSKTKLLMVFPNVHFVGFFFFFSIGILSL